MGEEKERGMLAEPMTEGKGNPGPECPAETELFESISRTFRKYHKYLLCYGLNMLLHFYHLPF